MPTGTYRFVESRFIDAILRRGEVRLTPLSYYRKLEKEQGRAWIGDRLEATSSIRLGYHHFEEATSDRIAEFVRATTPPGLSPMMVPKQGATNVTVAGVKFSYQISEAYIFCASEGDLDELTRSMCDIEADAKDACIQVLDLQRLAHHIYYRGRIEPLSSGTMQLFQPPQFGSVRYAKLDVCAGEQIEPPDVFTKDIAFSGQREVRISLMPLNGVALSSEVVTIKIPKPERLFTEIFRNRPKSLKAT
jgi:hypothetical protein